MGATTVAVAHPWVRVGEPVEYCGVHGREHLRPGAADIVDGAVVGLTGVGGRVKLSARGWWVATEAGAGATVGIPDAVTRVELCRALTLRDDPGQIAGNIPWAGAVVRADGNLVVSCGSAMRSGIFIADGVRHGPVAALAPPDVIRAAGGKAELDARYFRGFLGSGVPAEVTPFDSVRRLPPGQTATWRPGRGWAVTRWLRDDVGRIPARLTGQSAVGAYLQAFDKTVSDMVLAAGGSIATHLSGGLDSSFMVAGLARAVPADTLIHAYVHVPVPAAPCPPLGIWDPDDSSFADVLAESLGRRVIVTRVANHASVLPLDAAAAASAKSGWPVWGTATQNWRDQIAEAAGRDGATHLFDATMGNIAFSHTHDYATSWLLGQRRPGAAIRAVYQQVAGGAAVRATVRHELRRTISAISQDWGAAKAGEHSLRQRRQWAADQRALFLDGLSMSIRGNMAAVMPAGVQGLFMADPFTSRDVVRAAAAVRPDEWHRGPGRRAFARTLGVGRVPDDVRLRTRRGYQSADVWWHMRNHRERYLAEAAMLAESPVVGELVDAAWIRSLVAGLPWGEATNEDRLAVVLANRILALAAYARTMSVALLKP